MQEVAADAFAAEFLLPRWLYRHHIRAQRWSVAGHLSNPDVVYQLSLRMTVSYEATCWGLLSHKILHRGEVDELLRHKAAQMKSRLSSQFKPGNSWANVWRLTNMDNGAQLTGNPDDLLRIDLQETSGSGYQWHKDALTEAGYEVLSDESEFTREPIHYGASAMRTLIARPPAQGVGSVTLREVQPWNTEAEQEDRSFTLNLELRGPEPGGLARAYRRRLRLPY